MSQAWVGVVAPLWQGLRAVLGGAAAGDVDEAGHWPVALRQAGRQRLVLSYQVFAAPQAPRLLELPTLALVYEPPLGAPGLTPRELRLPARPLWLVPLTGGAPAHQAGLGELRPDVGVQGLPTVAAAQRLLGCVLLALGLLGLGAGMRGLLVWLGVTARAQPFTRALPSVRRLVHGGGRLAATTARAPGGRAAIEPVGAMARSTEADRAAAITDERWLSASTALHEAFKRSAGRTLLQRDARAWALADARFAVCADEIDAFHAASAARFFGAASSPDGTLSAAGVDTSADPSPAFDRVRLLALARALARAEQRGLAAQAGAAGWGWTLCRVLRRAPASVLRAKRLHD
jgi:hypothetical protein